MSAPWARPPILERDRDARLCAKTRSRTPALRVQLPKGLLVTWLVVLGCASPRADLPIENRSGPAPRATKASSLEPAPAAAKSDEASIYERPDPDADSTHVAAGVHYVVRTVGTTNAGAEQPLPTIIAIHGLGDTPEAFVSLYRGLRGPARIIALRGLDEYGGSFGTGWSWFPLRARDPDLEALGRAMTKSAARIAQAVAVLQETWPMRGKPIVTGFSQGGMLSFALAVQHPGLFSAAVPISGWLPPTLWPEKSPPANAPAIHAFHGTADPAVRFEPTREATKALADRGHQVELSAYPDVAHTISRQMFADYHAHLQQLLSRAAQAVPTPTKPKSDADTTKDRP